MKNSVFIIIFITIISKVIGYSREIILSYFYGASNISDAFIISNTIPNLIFGFIIGGITISYIPIYEKICYEVNKEEAKLFTANLLNIILILCSIVIVFILTFPEFILSLFASGFDKETLNIATDFTKISIFGMYITALITIFTGYLQVNNKFLSAILGGFPRNAILITSVIISFYMNIYYLPLGVIIASIAHFLFMVKDIRSTNYKHLLYFDIKNKYIIEMIKMAIPVIIGASVGQINVLVDKTLASRISVGGISALNYSNILLLFIQGVFVQAIIMLLYPKISKMVAENNMSTFKVALSKSIVTISIFLIPASLGLVFFSEEIIKLLYGRGAFDKDAVSLTSAALFFYSIGIFSTGMKDVFGRVFYSMHDSKTPIRNGIVGVVLNIVLNIILSRFLGLGGLALATSVSAIITSLLLYRSIVLRVGDIDTRNIVAKLLKISFSALLIVIIAKVGHNKLTIMINENYALILMIIVSVVLYIMSMYLMRFQEFTDFVNDIKKRKVKGR